MTNENKKKKHPWTDVIKYEFDTAKRKYEIYKETLKWFETSEEAQEYFKDFNPDTLAVTLSSYAWRKAGWMVTRDRALWTQEYYALQYKNEAEACLSNIQQKKLFDRQCQWRAEVFTHPAIETTHDFNYWEHNVLNCPFIDPVTEEDVARYIEFLQTYLGENLAFLGGWQDYNTYNSNLPTVSKLMNKPKEEMQGEDNGEDEYDGAEEAEEKGSLMPPWYEFVNSRTGDGNFLLLPDVRQEREWAYGRIAQQEQTEIWAEKFKQHPPDKRLPLFLFGDDTIVPFIEEFEKDSKTVMDAYLVHQKADSNPEAESMEGVDEAMHSLRDCYESFPVAPGITDWKEALMMTARQWKNTKMMRILPVTFEEYIFRRQCGIEHPYDKEQANVYRKMADDCKERILRGRELKGEPRNLDF